MRLAAALTHHELPGASHNSRAERIDKPLAADIAQALAAIGVRKRKGKLHAGAYELGALLDDGTFQAGGTSEELMTELVALRPEVLRAVHACFTRLVFGGLTKQSGGLGQNAAHTGAVTFVQRFCGSLNLHVHFHAARSGRRLFRVAPRCADRRTRSCRSCRRSSRAG